METEVGNDLGEGLRAKRAGPPEAGKSRDGFLHRSGWMNAALPER